MIKDASELAKKIRVLSSEQIAEVDDVLEFIRHRDQERALTRAAAMTSAPAFAAIWNYPEVDVYDAL
jgi:hypothetical protein